jgi:hypothetical protein
VPRKSKAILDEEADYAILGDILKDSTLPAYQRLKTGGTRNAIRRTQAKRLAEKADRAAKRKAAEPPVYHSVLPNNFRGPPPGFVQRLEDRSSRS